MFGRKSSKLSPQRPIKVIYDPNGAPAVDMSMLQKGDHAMFKKAAASAAAFKKPNRKTGLPRNLSGLRAQVRFYLDISQSMEYPENQYYSRTDANGNSIMQVIAERFLSLGLNLDPDGVIEVIPFHHALLDPIKVGLTANPQLGIEDYRGVVNRRIWKGPHILGGTQYGPVLRDIRKAAQRSNDLIIAGIGTDGDPSDMDETIGLTEDLSQYGALLKFMGINDVKFLRTLDNLEETRPGIRLFDNVDTKIFGVDGVPSIFDIDDIGFADAMADEVDTGIASAIDAGVLVR